MKSENIKAYTERAKDLVAQMSLTEKISQLRHHSRELSKFGISEYNWWNECLHGVARAGIATVFPQAIAMASTFSEEILHNAADIISTEARAKHNEAVRRGEHKAYQGLTFWSPNLNIYRDPRWGRGQETYGECPTLTAKLGVAFIKGLQGENDKWLKVSACAKHFAAHSGPEAEKHHFNVNVSSKDLNETYLYAFEQAVKNANVDGIMTAYNRVNDEVCSASEMLITNILRGKWQFQGYVVSDCGAVSDIAFGHKTVRNPLKAVATAINNGLDLECGKMYSLLPLAVMMKYVNESVIDQALVRLLVTRIKLGMFDETCEYNKIPYKANATQENRDYAVTVAEKAIVMLKNNGILPLDKDKKVALLGYNANNKLAYLGNYYGTPSAFTTVYNALKERLADNLKYEKTIGLVKKLSAPNAFEKGLKICEDADYVIICTGLDSSLEGESGDAGTDGSIGVKGDRHSILLPNIQAELIERVAELGKKIILLNFSGGAISFERVIDKVDGILQCWYIGAEGGKAIARVLYGEVSPSGRLPITFYKKDEDLPNFYEYSMMDRTYRYFSGDVEYPFGYGLSYAKFEYAWAKINKNNDSYKIGVDVRNIGAMNADEVVQVYLKFPDGVVNQPQIKLIAFKRVTLTKNQKLRVEFELNKNDFAMYNNRGDKEWSNGEYKLFIGGGQPKYSKCEVLNFKI